MAQTRQPIPADVDPEHQHRRRSHRVAVASLVVAAVALLAVPVAVFDWLGWRPGGGPARDGTRRARSPSGTLPRVRHDRHYSLDEATDLLPWLTAHLAAMRDAHARLTEVPIDHIARRTTGLGNVERARELAA